jgi:pyrimidine-nucleoside phosphorylase
LAMRDSGARASIPRNGHRNVDKHSTGGVGDKVSICLAPWVAACGVQVPMIAGRGLGHTGGTLDKLEAIAGFSVKLPLKRFEALVVKHGFALIGQTEDLAPADRKLYALRDVTATVESIPLITASILSKKLAEDLDGLVLDVKVGRGAFMKNLDDARALAHSLLRVGKRAGVEMRAVLTRMDVPLGRTVGNALETREAFEVLLGGGPEDLIECTRALAVEMLRVGQRAKTAREAERVLDDALKSGAAVKKMEAIVKAQGGDARVVREPDRLPNAPIVERVLATKRGYVTDMDALKVAELCMHLGAGRKRAEDTIDPSVGVVLCKKPGDAVNVGDVLAELHVARRAQVTTARDALLNAYSFGKRAPTLPALVIERLRA